MKKLNLSYAQMMAAEQLQLIWNAKKKELDLTQEKVSKLCNWKTQAAFNAYLLGRVPLNIDAVLRLSKVLKVHPTEIMPALADLLPIGTDESKATLSKLKSKSKQSEDDIVSILRSVINDKNAHEKLKQDIQKLSVENPEKEKQSLDLILTNPELIFQLIEKEQKDGELALANAKLTAKTLQEKAKLSDLENIGQLTEDITHDFNETLACMLGYNEINNFIFNDITNEASKSELERNTKEIAAAGQRAVELIEKIRFLISR
jgi:transcriptional regulator with XRE-family HTH domain